MTVREYWPAFVERVDEPREQQVATMEEALEIPWLKEKGRIEIKGGYVKLAGTPYIVATFRHEPGNN